MDYTKINNALEIIKEQRNIILCELLREFPIGCSITYINEDNIQTKAIVINHRVTDDNIPKLDIRTIESKKVKLIPITKIINKTITESVISKQEQLTNFGKEFNIKDISLEDEKRLEIFRAALLKNELNCLLPINISSDVNINEFMNFLLHEDGYFPRYINNCKFEKFVRIIDALLLNKQELIQKHKVNNNYQKTIFNEILNGFSRSFYWFKGEKCPFHVDNYIVYNK